MPLHRGERREDGLVPRRDEEVRESALLLEREEEIGLDADHEDARADARHGFLERSAVLGGVEEVHRAREVQVRVRVERRHEAVGVALEVRLDLELDPERRT